MRSTRGGYQCIYQTEYQLALLSVKKLKNTQQLGLIVLRRPKVSQWHGERLRQLHRSTDVGRSLAAFVVVDPGAGRELVDSSSHAQLFLR